MHVVGVAVLLAGAAGSYIPLQPSVRPAGAVQSRARPVTMGRKFENNKVKMAKTALAYAKKARALGPPMPGAPCAPAGHGPSLHM